MPPTPTEGVEREAPPDPRSASIGVAAIGGDDRIIGTSAALEALLERTHGELVGRPLIDHVEDDDRALDAALLAELHAGKRESYELERRYRNARGRSVLVREFVSRVAWAEGPGRLVVLTEAIDEHRRGATTQARETLVRLGEAAVIISHEVRNALAGIRSAVEVIGDALPPGGMEDVAVDEVRGRIADLDSAGSELLAFARVPRLASVSAHAVLAEVGASLVSSSVRVAGEDVLLRVDAAQMAAALVDLFRDGPAGTTLEVRVEHDVAWATLRIRPSRPSRPSWGTGPSRLGVQIAQRVVAAHGGELALEGDGAVTVRLPAGSDPVREAS